MSDRAEFERQFPSRNKWLGNRYDHPMDQARWDAWRAARRWRPISEAPKDGRPIVVTDFDRYAAVRWRTARDATHEQWAIDDVNMECWYPTIDCFEPTHFQPLEPPHE